MCAVFRRAMVKRPRWGVQLVVSMQIWVLHLAETLEMYATVGGCIRTNRVSL